MRALDVALKDLTQIVRDWKAAMFLLLMPIVFTFFFGMMYGSFDDNGDPRLPVALVLEEESGFLAETLGELLEASEAIRPVLAEGDAADDAADSVADGDFAAAVVVPAGFTDFALSLASGQTMAGDGAGLTVIGDQSTQSWQTVVGAIQAAMTRLLGAVQTAQISADAYDSRSGFEGDVQEEAYVAEALSLAIEAWQDPPVTVVVEISGAMAEEEEGGDWNPYSHASAGMMIQFVVFGLNTSAMVLVLERKSGALQRILTTPISRTAAIAGHVLAMFVVVMVQQSLLVAFGQLVLDVDYAREPIATLLLMAVLALWAASLGLLIGAVAKEPEHVIVLAMLCMFLFSALGGAWFPLDMTGEAFAAVGHLMPTAWAIDGFENIVVRGLGLESVLLPAGIVLAYAVAFFVVAVWRFKFE